MTRFRNLSRLSLLVSVCLGLAWPAAAQRILASTTNSAAIAYSDTILTVGSATNINVRDSIWCDCEMMSVQSKVGNTLTVTRGVQGTQQAGHAASRTVWVFPLTADWHNVDPDFSLSTSRGTGQATVLPWLNVRTCTFWYILGGTGTSWVGTRIAPVTDNSEPPAGAR